MFVEQEGMELIQLPEMKVISSKPKETSTLLNEENRHEELMLISSHLSWQLTHSKKKGGSL
jgi:hypothetical protein